MRDYKRVMSSGYNKVDQSQEREVLDQMNQQLTMLVLQAQKELRGKTINPLSPKLNTSIMFIMYTQVDTNTTFC